MNVLHKVTLQALRKNKLRTVVTIIGVVLSAAMICAVTTFTSSIRNFALEYAIYTDGDWHGAVQDATWEDYRALEASGKVADAAYCQVYGYATVNSENEFKPYVYVLGAEGENYFQTMPVHLLQGRLPVNETELLLPEHLSSNGGVTWEVGDTVTLSIGTRTLEGYTLGQYNPCYAYDPESKRDQRTNELIINSRQRTYTVVGIYERPGFEPRTAPGYTALTVADPTWEEAPKLHIYFNMKKPADVYNFMTEMGFAKQYSYDFNNDVLLYSGVSYADSFSVVLYSLAAIVIGLIVFGSVSLIYNAFSISVAERTKQFGLLSSVGATKKQLKGMVLFEALAVSSIGIPLGILAGIGGIGVTLLLIGKKFSSLINGAQVAMRLCVSWQSVVIAAAVSLITVLLSAWIPSVRVTRVTAMEAIRQNMDVKHAKPVKTSRLTYKLFGLPGVLASHHYRRNRKKYRTTVVSLFMSVVLFVSATAFSDYLNEATGVGLDSVGYDLYVSLPGDAFEKLTPDQLLERMKGEAAVTDGTYCQTWHSRSVLRGSDLTEEGKDFLERNGGKTGDPSRWEGDAVLAFVDDSTFEALLRKNGLSREQFLNPEKPLGIAVDGGMVFDINTQRYESTVFFQSKTFSLQLKREKEMDGYYHGGEIIDQKGNRLVIYRSLEGNEQEMIFLTPEEAYSYSTCNVGYVTRDTPFFDRNRFGLRIIYPISLAQQVVSDFDPAEYYYAYTLLSRSHQESYGAVKLLLSNNGLETTGLLNVAEEEESQRNTVTIIRVFSYGFVVLISLIAATNVFNTISTNIGLRRREFAMLRSVGMTQKGFNRMMNFECLLYGSRALLFGLPAACGVTYLIYLAMLGGYDTTFRLPWTAMGVAALSVFLVVLATMMYAMGKLKREDPVQTLKNENI